DAADRHRGRARGRGDDWLARLPGRRVGGTCPSFSPCCVSATVPEQFDLVVIGAGPAGEKGAAQAAYFGKRVCLIERAPKPGGAAVNTGTIPSKTLRETALHFSGLKQRGLYGVDVSVKRDITIGDFMHRERAVIEASWTLI